MATVGTFIERNCTECEQKFSYTYVRGRIRVTCSRQCQSVRWRRLKQGLAAKEYTRRGSIIEGVCTECGLQFKYTYMNGRKSQVCSIQCRRAQSKRTRYEQAGKEYVKKGSIIEGVCSECKQDFKRMYPGRAKKFKTCSPECQRARQIRLYRVNRYGITLDIFDHMIEDQNYQCAICHTNIRDISNIDHCHDTGKVRGLLCTRCNSGLGNFVDDPDILRAALAYLEYWKGQQ